MGMHSDASILSLKPGRKGKNQIMLVGGKNMLGNG
eukprot:CAMPEP_0174259698 /NCGR_PEP_ID=MMETSP0439-20130205/8496_1 /TAXON_ID=0 /ORGANISM="Stereomyxa ramosa, Strain Chinc5" /LENGTH=34 /DNA_ID= /DNA_START= /DNA_END= /DNA_ORIENTATION=